MGSAPWSDVPDGWELRPLLAVADESQIPNAGMAETNLLSLSYGRIVRRDIEGLDGLLPASFETYQIVEPGDVVCRFTDLQNDKRSLRSGLVTERGIITSAYTALKPRCLPRWMSYLLRAYDYQKVFYGFGGGVRQSLKFADVKRLPILLPPEAEQRLIADFLDRETAQIDAMVDAQERLIALLEERRRAALLNGTLGRTDFIWEGRLGRALRPLSRVPHTDAEVVTAYRDGAVLRRSERRDDGYTFSNLEQGYQGVEVGDFVFHGLDGFAGAVGVAASSGKCSPVYHVATATELANNRYLAYLLRSLGLSGYLEANAWSVRQRSVDYRNWKQLAALWVQLPALEAQLHLVRELEQQLGRIEAMIAKAQESIALMKERRAAVISAAVTGRIDVRTGNEQVERDLEEARA